MKKLKLNVSLKKGDIRKVLSQLLNFDGEIQTINSILFNHPTLKLIESKSITSVKLFCAASEARI